MPHRLDTMSDHPSSPRSTFVPTLVIQRLNDSEWRDNPNYNSLEITAKSPHVQGLAVWLPDNDRNKRGVGTDCYR